VLVYGRLNRGECRFVNTVRNGRRAAWKLRWQRLGEKLKNDLRHVRGADNEYRKKYEYHAHAVEHEIQTVLDNLRFQNLPLKWCIVFILAATQPLDAADCLWHMLHGVWPEVTNPLNNRQMAAMLWRNMAYFALNSGFG